MNTLDRQHHANGQTQYGDNGDRLHADLHHLCEHRGYLDGLLPAPAQHQPVHRLPQQAGGITDFVDTTDRRAPDALGKLAQTGLRTASGHCRQIPRRYRI